MNQKNIIVIGAGFGGITAALQLEKKINRYPEYRIILIDKNAYQLYTPAFYEIAAIPREKASAPSLKSAVAIPLKDIIDKKKITFIQDECVGLNKEEKKILLAYGPPLPYAYLVIALGSETNYFGIPGLEQYAYPLKRFEDTVRIRNKIEALLDRARPFSIVVGGGGPAGTELTAEFTNFLRCANHKNKNACPWRLILIESSPDILPGFAPWMVSRARKRLESLNIEIKTDSLITEVTESDIAFKDGKRIPYDMLIWTGGVKGTYLAQKLGFPVTQKGGFMMNEFLEIEKNIFAVGDNAGFINPHTGKPLVWNVPVAEGEARTAARNIARDIEGKQKKPFRPLARYPFILALGEKFAIADLLVVRFWGFWGWFAKMLVELRYLIFILPLKKAIPLWIKNLVLYHANDS